MSEIHYAPGTAVRLSYDEGPTVGYVVAVKRAATGSGASDRLDVEFPAADPDASTASGTYLPVPVVVFGDMPASTLVAVCEYVHVTRSDWDGAWLDFPCHVDATYGFPEVYDEHVPGSFGLNVCEEHVPAVLVDFTVPRTPRIEPPRHRSNFHPR